jgi:hypothetical protein
MYSIKRSQTVLSIGKPDILNRQVEQSGLLSDDATPIGKLTGLERC